MPSDRPHETPRDILTCLPTPPSTEPQILCVVSSGFRLRTGFPETEPASVCAQCVLNLPRSKRPWYEPTAGHYLQISGVDVDLRCHSCNNTLALTQLPSECDYCRDTQEVFLQYLQEHGFSWRNLPEIVRTRSGPPPPLPRIIIHCNPRRRTNERDVD